MLRAVHRSTPSFSSSNLLSQRRVQQQARAGWVSISKIDRNDDGTGVVRRFAALPVNSNSSRWQGVMRGEEPGITRSRRRSSSAIGPEFSTSVAVRLREIAVAAGVTPTPNVEERAMAGCCRTPTLSFFSATAMRKSGFPALTPAGTCGSGGGGGGGSRSLGLPETYRPGIALHGSSATVRTFSQKTNHESSETAGAAGSGGGGIDRPTTKTAETPTSSSPAATVTPPASSSVLSSALVGDQMTVIAVAVLTLLLVLSPALVDRIRNREQYDDFFNFDDPLDDLALELYRLSREECNQDDNEKSENDGSSDSGSKEESAAPRQKNVVENLLRDVFQSAALQQAAQQFVVTTLQSEPVRSALQRLLKELAMDLLQDPETIAQVVQLLNFAIQNNQVRKAAQELVIDLVNDPAVKAALVSVIQRLGQDGAVQEASQALLRDTAHAVLNDEDVMDHSMEFATDVLGDDVVQQTAGEALRNTVGHAVRPAATTAVWGAAGLAWMAVALLAISYANHVPDSRPSSSGADRGLDRALDGMDRTLTRDSATTNSGRLMDLVASLPGRVLSLLIWPFRLVAQSVQKPFVALGRTVQAGTVSVTNWVVSLPSRLTPSRESLSHLPGMVLSAVLRPLRALGRMAAASFSSIASGVGETLSAVSKRLSVSLQEGVQSAGDRFTQASANLVAWSIDVLRNLARVTWSRGSEATSWTMNQLGRSWTYVLSRAATAVTALRDTSPRYRAGMVDWMETTTGQINDALTDWSLATENFIRSFVRWNASK